MSIYVYPTETVELTATFTDSPGGVVVDPSAILLFIEKDGTQVAGPLTPTKLDTGLYQYDWTVPADADGDYVAKWVAVIAGKTSIGYETATVSAQDADVVVIAASDVKGWIGDTRNLDVAQLQKCVDAAMAWVNDNTDKSLAPVDSRKLGATMLAARLYGRRGSSMGVMTFDQLGASYISKYDADIYQLLGFRTILVG